MDAGRWLAAAVTLLVGTTLSGCVAFQSPLSEEKDSIADGRLVGIWRAVTDDHRSLYIGRVKDHPNALASLSVWIDEKGCLQSHEYSVFTTTINGVHYASVSGPAPEKKFSLVKYWVRGDTLNCLWLDSDAIDRAIDANGLSGTKSHWDHPPSGTFQETTVTASTAELVGFVKSAGPEIWNQFVEYERVK